MFISSFRLPACLFACLAFFYAVSYVKSFLHAILWKTVHLRAEEKKDETANWPGGIASVLNGPVRQLHSFAFQLETKLDIDRKKIFSTGTQHWRKFERNIHLSYEIVSFITRPSCQGNWFQVPSNPGHTKKKKRIIPNSNQINFQSDLQFEITQLEVGGFDGKFRCLTIDNFGNLTLKWVYVCMCGISVDESGRVFVG